MTVIIVTGTPGTGKSYVSGLIQGHIGFERIDVNKLIEENNLCDDYDEQRQCKIIDIDKTVKILMNIIKKGNFVVDSHFIHHIPVNKIDLCIVTKCDIKILKQRLDSRGYSQKKVRENLDAEIFDICLTEAEEQDHNILIIDTTNINDEEIIDKIKEKIK